MNRSVKNNNILNIIKKTEVTDLLIIIAMFCFLTFTTKTFFDSYNLTNMLRQAAVSGVLAVAMAVVLISGNIDLSIGSTVGLTSAVAAILMSDQASFKWSPWSCVIIGILSAVLIGFLNGVIVNETKIPPFIATLGMQQMVRGVIRIITNAQTYAKLPQSFNSFSVATLFGISSLFYCWIAIVVITFIILKFTAFGRNIFVVGSNNEVARLSGINVKRIKLGVYTLCGLYCGIAGIMLTSRLNCAVPGGGQGYEGSAIASSVIGGVGFGGATGNVWGTVLGTLLFVLIENGGSHLEINPFIMDVIKGGLLILAVSLDKMRKK